MSVLKIPVLINLKFSLQNPLQQNKTTLVNFLKARFFNSSTCKNHNENISLFDTINVQKYLKFIENGNSDSNIVLPESVKNICKLLQSKKKVENELKCLEEMSSEGYKELKELIEVDKEMLLNKIRNLKNEIIDSIVPVNEDDERNVELQVVPNIGGEEAKLFAKEIFKMYYNYVNYKNWEYCGDPESGYLLISGDNIYGQLKYEMGIHRVQRVPETENLGRTHTSTCTVLVLPQPMSDEIVFNEKDVIFETMRSSGPGGQNVNKTESCVRVTHKATGIQVENQTSRFQYENKKLALNRLRGILFNMRQDELKNKIQQLKKQHVATNIYSSKIRTYNFNQNRVTDHRTQFTVHNLKGFLSGTKELDRMVQTVKNYIKQDELKFYIQNVLQSNDYKKYENKN